MIAHPTEATPGRLVENIMHFGRVLRAAGLPVGPGKVIDAVRAAEAAGITRRDDFYWALHTVLVNRRDQRELFDQAFHLFWRNPDLLKNALSVLLPKIEVPGEEYKAPGSRRLADALSTPGRQQPPKEEEMEVELDATMTYSERERLQKLDFEAMSADEIRKAKRLIAAMRLPIVDVPTRRFTPDDHGRLIDMRASLRAGLRSGGDIIPLRRRTPRRRHPPLVVLCDISGSMSRYSRMFLHFMHAMTSDRDRVHSFVFATRLTNITRQLRNRDVDIALALVGETVEDWSGGTQIGQCLKSFNRVWTRRVLGQGAVVLFVSDGLDRAAGEGLSQEIERLSKSCRRLIWLNPLLRYEGFEPRSYGVRAILPHVDDFRSVHNLESLADLTAALGRSSAAERGRRGTRREAL